jgi:hypothetical protein
MKEMSEAQRYRIVRFSLDGAVYHFLFLHIESSRNMLMWWESNGYRHISNRTMAMTCHYTHLFHSLLLLTVWEVAAGIQDAVCHGEGQWTGFFPRFALNALSSVIVSGVGFCMVETAFWNVEKREILDMRNRSAKSACVYTYRVPRTRIEAFSVERVML